MDAHKINTKQIITHERVIERMLKSQQVLWGFAWTTANPNTMDRMTQLRDSVKSSSSGDNKLQICTRLFHHSTTSWDSKMYLLNVVSAVVGNFRNTDLQAHPRHLESESLSASFVDKTHLPWANARNVHVWHFLIDELVAHANGIQIKVCIALSLAPNSHSSGYLVCLVETHRWHLGHDPNDCTPPRNEENKYASRFRERLSRIADIMGF